MAELRAGGDLVEMAEHETMRQMLRHLQSATMLPGSFDKRFVADVWQRAPAMLTPKQSAFVKRLVWKYRRQMPADLAALCKPTPIERTRANAS
jgi:hypothetical protein